MWLSILTAGQVAESDDLIKVTGWEHSLPIILRLINISLCPICWCECNDLQLISSAASHLWLRCGVLKQADLRFNFVPRCQKGFKLCHIFPQRSRNRLARSVAVVLSSFTQHWEKGDSWQCEVICSIDHAVRERLRRLQRQTRRKLTLYSEADEQRNEYARRQKKYWSVAFITLHSPLSLGSLSLCEFWVAACFYL